MTRRSTTNTSIRVWCRYFPLISIQSLVDLFEAMLQTSSVSGSASTCSSTTATPEPNLAFLSIILGYVESHITASEPTTAISTPKRSRIGARSSFSTDRSTIHPCPCATTPISASSGEIDSSKVPLLPEEEIPAVSTPSLVPSDSTPSPTPHSLVDVAVESGKSTFPKLCYEEVEQLHQRFYTMIVHNPKLASMVEVLPDQMTLKKPMLTSNRLLVKTVCDVLWAHMSSSARQREHFAHAQSIYSLLKYGQLDSFGLAYTTVAACQLLGYTDVHLALSEDHAWVEFGPPERRETADVSVMPSLKPCEVPTSATTYPPPIRLPHLFHSWIYLNGYPVICSSLALSVAAAVTAIQPCGLSKSVRLHDQSSTTSVSSSNSKRPRRKIPGALPTSSYGHPVRIVETICPELVRLKQALLWSIYRMGMLNRYPLGLTNLANIEEDYPSGIRFEEVVCGLQASTSEPDVNYALPEIVEIRGGFRDALFVSQPLKHPDIPFELLRRAVEINRMFFHNQHVYPYIYMASYLRHRGDVSGALRFWAEAARVIGQYNHSSEDAEIYREFLDIATRAIPEIFRLCAMESRSGVFTSPNLLDSPLCLAYLLAFYDRLCLWEEGSAVPVLHVGWADKLVTSLTHFSAQARTHLHLEPTQPTEYDEKAKTLTARKKPSHLEPTQPTENDEKAKPLTARKKPSRLHSRLSGSECGSVDIRPIAILESQPSPLPIAEMELALSSSNASDIVDGATKAEPLRVVLPPPTTSMSFQSCSTTGSSGLSAFNSTPLPSGGENSTFMSIREAVARSSQQKGQRLSPKVDPLPEMFDISQGDEENFLDDYSLVVDCCTGPKEKVIARLARASQFRLLNPAFLMGDLSAPPFVTSEELNDFLIEQEPFKEVQKGESRFLIEAPSLTSAAGAEQGHKGEEVGIVEPKAEDEEEKGVTSLPLRLRVSSPDSSVCPSLPSISSASPAFALSEVTAVTAPLSAGDSGTMGTGVVTTGCDTENKEEGKAIAKATDLSSPRFISAESETPLIHPPIHKRDNDFAEGPDIPGVYLRLYSIKMCRIAHLLKPSGCLKSSAIKLTLTAQSQVDFGRR